MVIIAVLQRVYSTDEVLKKTSFGFIYRIRQIDYKGVFISFPDPVASFALEAGVKNTVAMTCYSPVLAHMAVLRSSKIDWDHPDCSGWYSYEYRINNIREVPSTHLGGRNFSGSKSPVRKDLKFVNLIDVQAVFDEQKRVQ